MSSITSSQYLTLNLLSLIANLNVPKLDSAIDVDPLFYKLSQTFDEGGAKGLLLYNLKVSPHACQIVLDSSSCLDEINPTNIENEPKRSPDVHMITLKPKDWNLLSFQSSITKSGNDDEDATALVPQLAGWRASLEALQSEGIDINPLGAVPTRSTNRFAPLPSEEKEADRSIHQDALERSQRFSRSFDMRDTNVSNEEEHNDDDDNTGSGGFQMWAEPIDDDDDDCSPNMGLSVSGGNGDFEGFLAENDASRFSGISFKGSAAKILRDPSSSQWSADAITQSTVNILNDMAKGLVQPYEFVGNAWAGAAHWKRPGVSHNLKPKEDNTTSQNTATDKTPQKKASRRRKAKVLVNVRDPPNLDDILLQPPKSRKKGVSPLQWTDSLVMKYSSQLHLLPVDAGLGIAQLSSLFLRPQTQIPATNGVTPRSGGKVVAFSLETPSNVNPTSGWDAQGWGGGDNDNDNDSCGGDGPGFQLANDEYDDSHLVMTEPWEDIRKVPKVHIDFATVAKKVDVKRLKKDLWTELQEKLQLQDENNGADTEEGSKEEEKTDADIVGHSPFSERLSFQEVVKEMEAEKAQADVTLPFYFICILHLANEKGLRLESKGLEDFVIYPEGDLSLHH
jgi:condensin complex subunit 2